MLRFFTYLIGIAFIFITTSNAQIDPTICPGGPTTIPDPRWRPVPPRFEIITELVRSDGAMELSQAFSSTRDAIALNAMTPFNFYWNFLTNEHFDILNEVIGQQTVPVCARTPLVPESQTSIFLPKTLLLKPSALLGYDARNQPNPLWGCNYDGDGELRGIPTNKFKSCFYVNDIQATVATTYHVSDVTKFQAYLPANQSLILQIDVMVSNSVGARDSYSYNIFRYIPNPSRREERQALETPAGVYCPNRTQTLAVPSNIPDRASSNTESFIPILNNSIISSHSLYDTEFQFSRFDAWYPDPFGGPAWSHMTELHDFGVGLSYHYNHSNYQCSVRDLDANFNDAVPVDGNPSLFQMGNPQHLFLMDDITYHYTGEKQCRDRVWCHVWIGEKSMPNNTVQHREWYWASSVNGEPLAQWIPMKLVIKQMLSGVPVFSAELIVFNFRRNPMTIFEIDYTLAECYRALGHEENFNLGVISFTVANDKEYPVQQNIDYLRYTIWETLIFTLFVRPIRIANIIVDHDGKDLLVTFTMLDKPPRSGPVEVPLQEQSLTTAIDRLRTVIDANGLAFRAKYDNKQVILRARINSLKVIYTSFDQNAGQCVNQTVVRNQNPTECPDTTTKQNQNVNQIIDIEYKSSGPLITGFWIGFLILGLFVGIVGGFFVFKRFSKQ